MKFSSLAILFVFALIEEPDTTTEAFSSSILATTATKTTTKTGTVFVAKSRNNNDNIHHKLSAVVYGWDDDWEDEDDDDENEMDSTTSSSYSTVGTAYGSCSSDGAAVAKSLTGDVNKVASLARLAAAFSPPERGIAIEDIERVEVVCVQDDKIELEAMLCESLGCVSLSVPIIFPNSCSRDDQDSDAFVGCVNKNIDDLDTRAESTLSQITSFGGSVIETYDLNDLSRLDETVEYPPWWIPSNRYGKEIETECDTIRVVVNDEEFMTSVVALAQDTLEHANNHPPVLENANANTVTIGAAADIGPGGIRNLIEPPEKLIVKRAKVAAIGPAGICMKIAAMYEYQKGLKILDVVYPFPKSVTPVTNIETLRSIVLGAIIEAEA